MGPTRGPSDGQDQVTPIVDVGAPTDAWRYSVKLYVYTSIEIIVGLALLAWASVSFDIWPTISLTHAADNEGKLLGLVFWTGLGLLGGTRAQNLHGHGVLTFQLPFIIAATALGGPVAGGWVALVGTFEAREITDLPWYGIVANHSAMAMSAVLGGLVFGLVRNGPLGAVPDEAQATQLVAIVVATLILSGLSAGLAAGTVFLRDGISAREATRVLDTSFRKTSASEVVVGWVLVLAYGTVGWWAALICASLVLVTWRAHDAREIAGHDAMTGLLNRSGFDARLEEILVGVRRGAGRAALLAIDLDGFKAVNDRYGHAAGDDVIREVGVRLRESIRLTDAAVRRGGDEFGVLLAGISDADAAERIANKIWVELCRPVETDKGALSVGASIGAIIIEPSSRMPTIDRLHALADHEMYLVKKARTGGGVRVRRRGDPPPMAQPAGRQRRRSSDRVPGYQSMAETPGIDSPST
jgi:diguanylate cyclase (GGDEF)-like protein